MLSVSKNASPAPLTPWLAQLAQYPKQAADTVRPFLKKCSLPEYRHFLYMMYHYTKDSENKLLHAAELSTDNELKEYFTNMAREERGHYMLALRDYEEFGLTLDIQHVPAAVTEFNEFWYRLGRKDCNEFLGALYVFESVASLVGEEIVDLIKRLDLNKKQCRWLAVHAEADQGHGNEAKEMCEKYISRNPQALIAAASGATEKWSAVFVNAFSGQK